MGIAAEGAPEAAIGPNQGDSLLERGVELHAMDQLIQATLEGDGHLVLAEGPPGIGKTALLGALRSLGERAGMTVLTARGAEIEREFPFGVARQLFERRLARSSLPQRRRLLAGDAQLAQWALRPDGDESGERREGLPVVHGLYWLCANLAELAPLLIAVDDVHWADTPSLRWLSYTQRRLEGLPILLALAVRSTRPEAPVAEIEAMRAEPKAVVIVPAPLSRRAARTIVEGAFNSPPAEEFVAACHEASGGNPFLLRELVKTLAAEGRVATAEQSARVRAIAPETIARSVVSRLGHLPASARELALAVAVLEADAELATAARLAHLDAVAAGDAADVLTAAGILTPERPLRFVHPMLRVSLYDEIPVAARGRRHAEAARLLADRGASLERVAAHLLATEPDGAEWVVGRLREAATWARERGAPEAAIRYLRRACAEPPARAHRTDLWSELGTVAFSVDPVEAVDALREALAIEPDPERRSRITLVLAKALTHADRPREAIDLLEAAVPQGPRTAVPLAMELEAELLLWGLWWADNNRRPAHLARLERAAKLTGSGSMAERQILTLCAWRIVIGDGDVSTAIDLARRAWGQGIGFRDEFELATVTGMVFLFCDELAFAEDLFREGIESLRSLGRLAHLPFLYAHLAHVLTRAGRLVDAETEARTGWELIGEREPALPAWWYSVCSLLLALVERGAVDEAADLIAAQGLGQALPDAVIFPLPREVRGLVRIAAGETESGVEDLLAAGRWFEERQWTNPTRSMWSTATPQALITIGRSDDARSLARRTLERARRFGSPWALGRALRAAGLAEGGEVGLDLLRESVLALTDSPAGLEYARSLIEFGAALRRANRRAEARGHLERGMDLARSSGALGLTRQAHHELRATGARPRRLVLSGLEALTPKEHQVAHLAAAGKSNPEIAQALFVTRKTVETHLSAVYRKLEVGSRTDLSAALSLADT
ncbi:MAG TPA: LuxR C-terminal-related transcriptional regulator [Streptosporangiaceae bacterium]